MMVCGLLTVNVVVAQTMSVKSVSLQASDRSAIEHPCLDNNGDTCALVKIKTDGLEGIEFTNKNQYIQASYSEGVYWVYVPTISRKLDLVHKDYIPFELNLGNYGYNRLKAGKTYLVILEAPKIHALLSSVIFKVEPKEATITFNGERYEGNENGTYEIAVSEGRYNYTVKAENYVPQSNVLSVGNKEAKAVTVRLLPIMHPVTVACNVSSARVYVDNVDYGNAGLLKIPQGMHHIRVQADGYVDESEDVNVRATTGSLSFTLSKNKKVTHIHATPVTIYSSSTNIYKNNKKIKEWSNGATIMFMPGKYMLSDDANNTKIIVVKDEPMTINL